MLGIATERNYSKIIIKQPLESGITTIKIDFDKQ